jgi:uncharacterized membrane protein
MDKPKMNPPLTTIDYILEAIAGITLIYMIILLIVEFPDLADRVAIHFDASGNPDDWGDKSTLLILPITSIVLYVGMTILNKYPFMFNYPFQISDENAARQYQLAKSLIIWLKTACVGLFAYINYITIALAENKTGSLGSFFVLAVMTVTMGPILIYFVLAYKNK